MHSIECPRRVHLLVLGVLGEEGGECGLLLERATTGSFTPNHVDSER